MDTLLIDIGNTRIKWAFIDSSATFDIHMPMNIQACATNDLTQKMAAFDHPINNIIYSSVIGEDSTKAISNAIAQKHPAATWHQLLGNSALKLVSNPYQQPEQLGADRRALVIACALGFPNQKILTISSGTTLTIDLIDSGSHIGGIIAPGFRLMSESLNRGTAALPMTAPQETSSFSFGTSTNEAIRNGIKASQVGTVTTAIEWAEKQIGIIDGIIFDGGDAPYLVNELEGRYPCSIISGLVLKGLFGWYRKECDE